MDAGPRGGKRKRCVAPQGGGGGGGGASQGPIDLEAGGQGEGGHSEGELDRMLQEQLARIRGSWSHASSWCTGSLDVLAWCVSAQAAAASEGDPVEIETGGGGEGDETGEGGQAEVFTSHFEGLYGLTPMCSEGELDRILQEQLARLRGSWSHESSWHCSR